MKTKPQMGLKKVFASNKMGKIAMQEITSTIRLTNDKGRKISNEKRKSEFVFSDRTSSSKKKKKEKISDKGLIRGKIKNFNTEEKKSSKRDSLSSHRNKSIPIKKKLSENFTIEEENKNLKKTILILKTYINVMNFQFEKTFHKYITEKQTQINILQLKNEFLLKENNSLKTKIREMIYISKLYAQQEEERQIKYHSYLSQLLKENSYLRKSNLSLLGLTSTVEINKSLFDTKHIDEVLSTTTKNIDSLHISINPFIKNVSKVKHKRQRTHVNLDSIDDEPTIIHKSPTIVLDSTPLVSDENFPNESPKISSVKKQIHYRTLRESKSSEIEFKK